MSTQAALAKLHSMKGQLSPWRGDLNQVGPFHNFQYVNGFSGERRSGFVLDRYNNPVLAYVHDANGVPNSQGVLLACNSIDPYGINLWPGAQEVYLSSTRLGIYRIGQGIFDNAGNCIGNLGPQQRGPGGENHFTFSFAFRSGTRGTISYVQAPGPSSMLHTNFRGDPISIEQGSPTQEEKHWLIVLHLLITAEILSSHWPAPGRSESTGGSFSVRMLLTGLFLVLAMPIINHFVFKLMFPGYVGSMTITKVFFCIICFFISGRVFHFILFGTALFSAIFGSKQKEPATRAERIEMEKRSGLNLFILPTGFIFGFLWGFVLGLFDKQLYTMSTAWTMGLYGFGFALLLFILIKLSLISMFAFVKHDTVD